MEWRSSHDEVYLHDIVDAARLIGRFIAGIDKETFRSDPKVQSAVIYRLRVIAEAATRISISYRLEHKEIIWSEVAKIRDILRSYHKVNLNEVWNAATRDVPDLLAAIEPLLPPNE